MSTSTSHHYSRPAILNLFWATTLLGALFRFQILSNKDTTQTYLSGTYHIFHMLVSSDIYVCEPASTAMKHLSHMPVHNTNGDSCTEAFLCMKPSEVDILTANSLRYATTVSVAKEALLGWVKRLHYSEQIKVNYINYMVH